MRENDRQTKKGIDRKGEAEVEGRKEEARKPERMEGMARE